MQSLLQDLQAEKTLVVNNAPTSAADEWQGSNQAYEFSAYQQLCKGFTGKGPFLLVNDTLLTTHWQPGWLYFFKKARQNPAFFPQGAIAGDIRWVKSAIPEIPQPFLASWVFWLQDEVALQRFTAMLEQALTEKLPEPGAAYTAYLEAWFQPSSFFRGWHGQLSPENLARKMYCVRLEHRLCHLLAGQQALLSLGDLSPRLYQCLRIIDRSRTRFTAWKKQLLQQ
jgi:hypothetical protein